VVVGRPAPVRRLPRPRRDWRLVLRISSRDWSSLPVDIIVSGITADMVDLYVVVSNLLAAGRKCAVSQSALEAVVERAISDDERAGSGGVTRAVRWQQKCVAETLSDIP
jgi:hypothetical protein